MSPPKYHFSRAINQVSMMMMVIMTMMMMIKYKDGHNDVSDSGGQRKAGDNTGCVTVPPHTGGVHLQRHQRLAGHADHLLRHRLRHRRCSYGRLEVRGEQLLDCFHLDQERLWMDG